MRNELVQEQLRQQQENLDRAREEAARRRALRAQQRLQRFNMVATKKKLSKWSTEGLDITNAVFSKLHAKESRYEEDKKKYNLEPEKFRRYTEELVLKVNRISAVDEFTINNGTDDCSVLKEYSRLTEANVRARRNTVWPATDPTFANQSEADQFTDKQIKVSTVGSYIHDSLTQEAKEQLNADKDKFTVTSDGTTFFDGPSYFHFIATLVDPDNGHLVEATKSEL